MAGCVSCLHAKATRGRAAFRQVRNGSEVCDTCRGPVCRLHANRSEGSVRCRECAHAWHRQFVERLQAGEL